MVCVEERVESNRIRLNWQAVIQTDPVDVRIKVNMGLWCQINGLMKQRPGNVQLVRPARRFEEHGAATGMAKAATGTFGCHIPGQRAAGI